MEKKNIISVLLIVSIFILLVSASYAGSVEKTSQREAEVGTIFNKIDLNHDNQIDWDEYKHIKFLYVEYETFCLQDLGISPVGDSYDEKAYFNHFSYNGVLNKDQFYDAFSRLYYYNFTPDQINDFKIFDKNKDSLISFEEYTALENIFDIAQKKDGTLFFEKDYARYIDSNYNNSNLTTKDKLHLAFEVSDLNKDNYLSLGEFVPLTGHVIKDAVNLNRDIHDFNDVDTDHDGKITISEFEVLGEYLAKDSFWDGYSIEEICLNEFKNADKNHDGYLTFYEFYIYF